MDALEQIKQTFFQECDDLLAELEVGLLALREGNGDSDTINAVFRAVHSVKGGAGAFGLEDLVSFAHVFETTLDLIRSGKIAAVEPTLGVLLRSADLLADLVAAAKAGGQLDPARASELSKQLAGAGVPASAAAHEIETSAEVADEFGFVPQRVALADFVAPAAAPTCSIWRIAFTPQDILFTKANDAIALLKELARLGACRTTVDMSRLPGLPDLHAETSYLSWMVELHSNCTEKDVREVFEFVEGDCLLDISRPEVAAETIPGESVKVAAVAPVAVAPDFSVGAAAQASGPAAASRNAGPDVRTTTLGVQTTIRVDLERIDRLINLVGEFVINQAMLSQQALEAGVSRASKFGAGLDDLEQLTREIQDSVMAIRAQPVKSVFQRMPRLVREIASLTGKQVRLVTEGEGTEVDKTVIEQLSDPITHMIRNAIDHGLEPPERRRAVGKSEEGCVRLAAIHRSGRIVIEVSDDGAGIDRERVRSLAVRRGLISPDAVLTDEETDNLIFLAGFSTAEQVSNISGRGVGMDVVRRSIQALGGRISIASSPGRGSTFTLSLPLTLAVLDGMVVSVAGQTLIAPLTAIVETLRPKPEDVRAIGPYGRIVVVRDMHLPLIDLGVAFGSRDVSANAWEGVCLIVETEMRGRAALLVDSIEGQRQVVIKSLEANYRKVDLVAAATILGDGRVALIVDVDTAVETGRRDGARPVPSIPMQLAS